MVDLFLTDDRALMEKLGKDIIEDKPSLYSGVLLDTIIDTIKHNLPNAGEDEIKRELYRSTYDYWVFGNNIDEEYFYHFYDKTAAEKQTYMTMRVRGEYVKHLNNPQKAYLFNDKYETFKLLGKYYYRDVIKLENDNDFELFKQFVAKHNEFIVKPLDMGMGLGVHKYVCDNSLTLEEHFRKIMLEGKNNNKVFSWSKSSSIVLEEIIIQDDSLAKFHPNSVNAVRLTTVRIDGHVIVYYPWLKVGNNGSDVATAAIGGMDAGIDAETGIINTSAIGEDGSFMDVHPYSNIQFVGYQIPRWDELIKLATEVAMMLPDDINYIGWDYVLTKNYGWCIMEGNYGGEFMWQLLNNRGMKKEFEELINWKMDKVFWWQ